MVKMNIDTDTQWSRALAAHRLLVPPAPLLAPADDRSYWDGIRAYYKKYEPYLNSQIGNPDGADKPNKARRHSRDTLLTLPHRDTHRRRITLPSPLHELNTNRLSISVALK